MNPWFPQTTGPLLQLCTLIIAPEGNCDVTDYACCEIEKFCKYGLIELSVVMIVVAIVVVQGGGSTETLLFNLYTISVYSQFKPST